MYFSNGDERLRPLAPAVPSADVGAPLPAALASDQDALLAYFGGLDVEDEHGADAVVVVRFVGSHAMYVGMPNDEAISGHPLAPRGLRPYEFVEVLNSGWTQELERRNRVHEHHEPAVYAALRHFALPFHDSTFECVASDVRLEGIVIAPTPRSALAGSTSSSSQASTLDDKR